MHMTITSPIAHLPGYSTACEECRYQALDLGVSAVAKRMEADDDLADALVTDENGDPSLTEWLFGWALEHERSAVVWERWAAHILAGCEHACGMAYGSNPDPCYLTACHKTPHSNRWGTTWA